MPDITQTNDAAKSGGSKELAFSVLVCCLFLGISLALILQLRNVDRAEQRVSIASEQFTTLSADIEMMNVQHSALKESLLSTKIETAIVKTQLETMSGDITMGEEVIKAKDQAVQVFGDLTERILLADKTIGELRSERNRLVTEIDKRRHIRINLSSDIDQLTESKTTLASAVRELVLADKKIKRLTEKNNELVTRNLSLIEQNDQETKSIAVEQKRLNAINEQVIKARSALEKTEKQRVSSQSSADILAANLLTINADSIKAKSKLDTLGKNQSSIIEANAHRNAILAETSLSEERLKELKIKLKNTSTELAKIQNKASELLELEAKLTIRQKNIAEREETVRLREQKVLHNLNNTAPEKAQ